MKKVLILLIIVSTSVYVHAQNLSFGPTGGLGHSWTNVELDGGKTKFHTAYNIGGKMVYSFVTSWGISGDIKFSSEGHTIEAGSLKFSTRANYIRIPLQGIYFFGKYGDRVRPKISIGPSFGFLVGGKSEAGANTIKVKTKESWNSFDFGFTGAFGGNVRIANATWLNLDLAYYHGITDAAKNGDGMNRNVGINIGVTFPVATVMPDKIAD